MGNVCCSQKYEIQTDFETLTFSMRDTIGKKYHFSKNYNVLKQIGGGSYGEVRLCKHKATQMEYAVKFIKKKSMSEGERQLLQNEINIMMKLDHPNIVKIFEYYDEDEQIIIVMEALYGGDLHDYIQKKGVLSEQKTCEIIQAILKAVNYCHYLKIMHRDLKSKNVMLDVPDLDKAQIKIIDFGTAKKYSDEKMEHQQIGTPYFIAPEVINQKYNQKCDIWSVGILGYQLLCGELPFEGKSVEELYENIKNGKPNFEVKKIQATSPDCIKLIKRLLNPNYNQRPNAQDALKDSWFKKHQKQGLDLNVFKTHIQNLKNFKTNLKIQEALWACMTQYLNTKEDLEKLYQTFQLLDIHQDGVLSEDELLESKDLQQLYQKNAKMHIKELVLQLDRDKNGCVDYSEFVSAVQDKKKLITKQNILKAFNLFDQDRNGTISLGEFVQMFSNNVKLKQSEWLEIFNQADLNRDGIITLPDFEKIMFALLENN